MADGSANSQAEADPPGIAGYHLLPVAGECDTPVPVEVVLDPIPVQVPPLAVPVEVREVPVAVRAHHVICKRPSAPPSLEYSRDCIVSGIYNSLAPRTK